MGPLILAAAIVAAPADREQHLDRWAPLIEKASVRFGIPVEWIRRVMQAESAGRTSLGGKPIRSRAGAIGLMQLMPGTWADMRMAYDLGYQADDPGDNILAGTAYLRLLYDRFGYPGLFAAYNAGPARYAAVLAGSARLPAETRAYLVAVAGPDSPIGRVDEMPSPPPIFVLRHDADGPSFPADHLPSASIFVALQASR